MNKLIGLVLLLSMLGGCTSTRTVEIVLNAENLDEHGIYSFVGKKISVESFVPELDENYILMDASFLARYEVVEQYSGKELPEIVEFEVYDHFGFPPFAKHEQALIYAREHDGILYHVKYSFDQVRFSSRYGWVTCGTSYDWDGEPILRPHKINEGDDCLYGNLANNIAKRRLISGDLD